MNILIASKRKEAILEAIQASGMMEKVQSCEPSVCGIQEQMRKSPISILVADQELTGGDGLSVCAWAAHLDIETCTILLAGSCDMHLAGRAVELGVFRLLPESAAVDEIVRALTEAVKRIRQLDKLVFEHAHSQLQRWRLGLEEAGKLSIFLSSGANLQEILEDQILPKTQALLLLRVRIVDWEQGYRWTGVAGQMAVMNWTGAVFRDQWQVSPAAVMEENTYAVFLWRRSFEGSPELDASLLDALIRELRVHLGAKTAVQTAGPFPVQKAPEQWRNLTGRELPQNAGGTEKSDHAKNVPPEVQLWSELLGGRQPGQILNHLHKYVASRWGGMPPSQDELRQMYRQFLQAVDLSTSQADFWGEVLQEARNYDTFIHGGQSLDSFFALVRLTVDCLQRLKAADETTLAERVDAYLGEHLEEDIRCFEMAKVFMVSADYLNRQFKKETGQTLKGYITLYKMNQARQLLLMTQLPVSMIASRVGYDNFSHFSAAYRKTYGESPGETRKSQKEKMD